MTTGYFPPGRRDALLRRLWPTLSRGTIAKRLGMEPSTVTYHAQRLGLPRKPSGRVPRGKCGTAAEYQRGCRCEPCRAANREYNRQYRHRAPRPPALHGTRSKYQKGCRCQECTEAQSQSSRERREMLRLKSATEKTGVGHGSLARFEMGCDCDQCSRAGDGGRYRRLATVPSTPTAWRCPCDAYRINQGPTCGTCGQQPPWIEAGNLKEAGR